MFGALKRVFSKSARRATVSSALEVVGKSAETADSESRSIVPFAEVAGSAPSSGEMIRVTYSGILKQLPEELHGKISPPSSARFSVPASQILEQLPKGAVKIPFGELRKAAPVGIFKNSSDQDARLVDLPLREILSQIKADAYVRREQQQRLEVPEEISDLFGRKGELLARLRVLQKDEILKPAPAANSAAPAAPALPGRAFGTPSSMPNSIPLSGPAPALKSTAAAAPALTPTVPKISYPGESLVVPLAELSKFWPEAVNREIVQMGLTGAKCELSLPQLGRAVQNGAVLLKWEQIRQWIRPAPPQGAVSPNGDMVLEIPLKFIASLTLAQGQASTPLVSKKASAPAPASEPVKQPAKGVGARSDSTTRSEPTSRKPKVETTSIAKPALVTGLGGKQLLRLPLTLISKEWPEALRREIAVSEFAQSMVELPREVVEPGLKTGKVEFLWKEIQECMKPASPAARDGLGAAFNETALELPLAVLVPVLFPNEGAAAPKRANVADNIPDLFNTAGKSQGAEAPQSETAPEGNVSGVTAPSEPNSGAPGTARSTSEPAPEARKKEPKNLAELFDEPDKRNWTPNEIVHKTTLLPDVRGALIALQDGLLVASCMPPEWKTETIAAFLPQIFGRMNQYAKELKMGELNSVSFTVDQGTLQIYNAGIIYFAALGQPGQVLPSCLNLIARELSRHTR